MNLSYVQTCPGSRCDHILNHSLMPHTCISTRNKFCLGLSSLNHYSMLHLSTRQGKRNSFCLGLSILNHYSLQIKATRNNFCLGLGIINYINNNTHKTAIWPIPDYKIYMAGQSSTRVNYFKSMTSRWKHKNNLYPQLNKMYYINEKLMRYPQLKFSNGV